MRKEVKQDIYNVIKNSIKAIRSKNISLLKDLSNHTIHDASIYQDEYSVSIAVVIYSLYKIFERSDYKKYNDWNLFYKGVVDNLKKAFFALKKNEDEHYERHIRDIFNVIDKLDSRLRIYAKDVFEQAKVHRASRLHEHGVSVGRTAEILGISEWELMDYIGKTGISDNDFSLSMDVKDRLKYARSLFK